MTLPSWNDGPEGGTPITADRLNAWGAETNASVKKWRPNTSYALGEPVVSPDGDLVTATVAHTSGSTYVAGSWALSTSFEKALPSGGTTTKFLRGDKTWQTIDLSGAGGGTSGADVPLEIVNDPALVSGPVGSRLTIPTHLSPSGGQTTHPSVLFFPEGWNGYRYWMAHTPYPAGNDDHEDPNVCASQDGITWVVPEGLTNPIADADGQPEYHSDVDLKMGPNGTMYLFWRFRDDNAVGAEENLFYSTSTDGVTWTPKVLFWQTAVSSMQLVSPSMIFEDNHWVMYGVDIATSPNRVVRVQNSTVDPETPWGDPVTITTGASPAGKEPWHIYVIKFGGRYYALRADCTLNANGSAPDLLFLTSNDGVTFTGSGKPVIPSVQAGEHDQMYRATMVPAIENGVVGFRVWYSGWTTAGPVWNLYRTFISAQSQEPWKALTLQNAWVAYTGGGGYTSGLRIKKLGSTVFLEGTVKSGAAGTVIATLPAGYAPAGTIFVPCNAAGAVGLIQIFSDAAGADARTMKYFLGGAAPTYLPISTSWQVV